MKISINEFHINRKLRQECNFDQTLFASSGNAIFADFKAVQKFQTLLNEVFEKRGQNENKVSAGNLNAMGLIDEIFHGFLDGFLKIFFYIDSLLCTK